MATKKENTVNKTFAALSALKPIPIIKENEKASEQDVLEMLQYIQSIKDLLSDVYQAGYDNGIFDYPDLMKLRES